MPDEFNNDLDAKNHAHRLTVFSVAAGMVGVCLTGIGLIGIVKSIQERESMVDKLLTVSALVFLISTAFNFIILRRKLHNQRLVGHLADGSFFLALVLLMVACVAFSLEFRVTPPQPQ